MKGGLPSEQTMLLYNGCFRLRAQKDKWKDGWKSYRPMIFVLYIGAGKSHQNANVLPRRPCFETNCTHCQRREEKELLEGGQGSNQITPRQSNHRTSKRRDVLRDLRTTFPRGELRHHRSKIASGALAGAGEEASEILRL